MALILCQIRIGQCNRIAFHIRAADIQQPHQIVQLAQKQTGRAVSCHIFTNCSQLFGNILSKQRLVRNQNRMARKCRSVRPDFICKIFAIHDFNLLVRQVFFQLQTKSRIDDTTIKSKCLTVFHLLL